MKVESILKRKDGTKLSLGGTDYHFKPDDQGRHVAIVKNQAHLAKLLSIPEGYRLVLDDEEHQEAAPVLNVIQEPAKVIPPVSVPENKPETDQPAVQTADKDKHGRSLDLVSLFAERFGRQPHHAWNDERIQSELNEA
ncbi:hypothetical protein BKM35_22140 [Salmonella enterica]|nr:hypothetical protein [Salmonella enterica]